MKLRGNFLAVSRFHRWLGCQVGFLGGPGGLLYPALLPTAGWRVASAMSREHKTKGKSKLLERGVLRQRGRNAGAEEAGVESDAPTCWSSALDPELYGAKERARKGRETTKKMKKSGRNEKNGERFDFEPGKEEDIPTAGSSPAKKGAPQIHKLSESLFKHWEDLLESRESFKRRIDTIAAVHGWEGASARRGLLGGVEPGSLLESIQAEAAALKPASKEVEKMGLLLELEALKKQLKAAGEEKDRLEDDLQSSREEVFQARDQLAGQHAQLETLLREVEASGRVTGADAAEKGSASQQGDRMGSALRGAAANADSEASDPLAVFKLALSREQVCSPPIQPLLFCPAPRVSPILTRAPCHALTCPQAELNLLRRRRGGAWSRRWKG